MGLTLDINTPTSAVQPTTTTNTITIITNNLMKFTALKNLIMEAAAEARSNGAFADALDQLIDSIQVTTFVAKIEQSGRSEYGAPWYLFDLLCRDQKAIKSPGPCTSIVTLSDLNRCNRNAMAHWEAKVVLLSSLQDPFPDLPTGHQPPKLSITNLTTFFTLLNTAGGGFLADLARALLTVGAHFPETSFGAAVASLGLELEDLTPEVINELFK